MAKQFITNKIIVGFNIMFDIRMLIQSMILESLDMGNTRGLSPVMVIDVMQLVVRRFGLDKFTSLKNSVQLLNLGIDVTDNRYHNALFDAQMTASCLRELIEL